MAILIAAVLKKGYDFMKMFLEKIEESISSILLISTSLLVFTQVILRKFFNYSIYWSEEVSLLMIVWFIFIGCSVAARENAHISMEILDNILPNKGKKITNIIINLISMVFCAILLYAGVSMVNNAIELNSMATSIPMPLWVAYASVPVGMGLMLIQYIFKFAESVKSLIVVEEDEVKR